MQKAPAATIDTLVKAILNLLNKSEYDVRVIGTRHGEKLYETLLSREEMVAAADLQKYFCVPPDLRDLNYEKFFEDGEEKISRSEDYNSHNTTRLDVAGMSDLLLKLEFVRDVLAGLRPMPDE